MKDLLQKIVAVFLALFLLGSTTSFTISKHYCGEHLVDAAIFGDAAPCAMEMALAKKYGPEHNKKSDCCSDQDIVIEGQDELKLQKHTVDLKTAAFVVAYQYSYNFLFAETDRHYVPFDGYPPPSLTQDFRTLYEQYLI